MVCKNCGSTIFEGDKFCFKCGMRVTEEVSSVAEEMKPGEKPAMEELKPEKEPAAEELKPEKESTAEELRTEKESAAKELKPEKEPAAEESKTEKVFVAQPEPSANAESAELPPGIPEEKSSRVRGGFRNRNTGKPKKWLPRVILGILGLIVVLLIANSARLINSYHRNFSTPEEYYRWVERRAVRKNAKTFAEYYASFLVEQLHSYDTHMSSEVRVELGDAGRDMMELAGVDLSWFEKGAFTYESTSKDGVQQSITGLEIGGEKLFSIETIMDLKDEAAYLGFPGLAQKYLAVDTGQREFIEDFSYVVGMEPEEYLESMELLELIYRECPDKRQMEALADRYLELLLNNIDNVKMRTEKTARVGDISQNCTTLRIYLDKNDIQEMLSEFLKELQEDSEIELLLVQIYDLAEELDMDLDYYKDSDDFYEAFQDDIDEILDDMDYYITYHDELDMTVYVDDKGQIIGRTMEFPNSWDEVSFSWLNPHKGSKFGYKGSITADGEEVSITGSGRDFGNKINGSFTVRYEGTGIVDIEVKRFDMNSLRKGYVNGKFTVTVSSGFGRVFDLNSASSFLADMELVIDVSTNRSSEKLSMELREDKELWGSLTITVKRGDGRKISVPSTRNAVFVDGREDFDEWWDTLKWDNLIKKMDKAGLPAEAVDAAEEISEMDADEFIDELRDAMWFLIYDMMEDFF